jgi:hypothetical protein
MNGHHFAMVSEWMKNGNINEFLGKHPDADQLGLVSHPLDFSLACESPRL